MKYLQQEVGRAWVFFPLGMSLGERIPRLSLPLVGGIYQSKVAKYTKNLATFLWPEERSSCQVQPSRLNLVDPNLPTFSNICNVNLLGNISESSTENIIYKKS